MTKFMYDLRIVDYSWLCEADATGFIMIDLKVFIIQNLLGNLLIIIFFNIYLALLKEWFSYFMWCVHNVMVILQVQSC